MTMIVNERLTMFLVLLSSCVSKSSSIVFCSEDSDCESILRKKSQCVSGECTNPFYNEGCVRSYIPEWHKTRVCNSEDPPEAKEKGYCVDSPFDYMELRISSQNWESVFLGTWILQIIMSEMLDVPTSVETSAPGTKINLYDKESSLDFGNSDDWAALRKGVEVGDCRKVRNRDDQPYVSCSHVIPEIWAESLVDALSWEHRGVIETPSDLGALGTQHWFIPKFTAQRDPSLTSYLGLQGNQNRRKLAERFLRPASWKEYCDDVSESNCLFPDNVTQRAPRSGTDEESYFFVEGLYTGHFRPTPRNDCDAFPENCTGHIADWPCPWTSYIKPQTHHLDISLESNGEEVAGGYSHTRLTQIWAAANHTKSDVIMLWWFPEALYQQYLGTDAEFTGIALPNPTQKCVNHRITVPDRCEPTSTLEQQLGTSDGACDYSQQVIQKVIGKGLYNGTYHSDIPEALISPAYAALKRYRLNELQIGEIFDLWFERGTDKWNFDLRDAACQWVVANLDHIKSFIPATYPRVIMEARTTEKSMFKGATALACLAIIMVLVSIGFTFLKRKKKSIVLPQLKFLITVLVGLLLVASGSLVLAIPPTDETCTSIAWLWNMGYVLSLVPILLRIDAINRLASSGKQMQRAKLHKCALFFQMLLALAVMATFLTLWTLMDPPHQKTAYELTDQLDSDGSTVVVTTKYCGSDSDAWMLVSVLWQNLILLGAGILAFMASRIQEDVNDTRSFTMLILLLFVFSTVQLLLFLISEDDSQGADMMGYTSLLYSSEIILAVLLYFVPKLMDQGNDQDVKDPEPDLFPNSTIMVAAIDGFSAWASVQEPSEVFKFLECIYGYFDDIAESQKIFKVETSANHYIAAAGIPSARADHAVLAAKFALDCMCKMNHATDQLDVVFGPDTSKLSLRIGIHSGPVTGGFLRGKGARFQLFGDTINTAGAMERSGDRGCIHISEATANLLIQAGKKKWVLRREDKVVIKSKGAVETYWLDCTKTRKNRSNTSEAVSSNGDADELWLISHRVSETDKKNRLIDWNTEVLQRLLKQIVARRGNRRSAHPVPEPPEVPDKADGRIPLDEVKEIIHLPVFDRRAAKQQKDVDSIALPSVVVEELKSYVTAIANMYRDNPFHNFDHASHVVQSTIKHLNRIVQPSNVISDQSHHSTTKLAATRHDHTYGITSDPLTQFACAFASLVHDVDHRGVPNPQLMKEDEAMGQKYKGRSIAEQNSFDLAWTLLMQDRFRHLRSTICQDSGELLRFQQLVINSVMATDIGDKLLKELRNGRWDKAFNLSKEFNESPVDAVNRKATIVIEHLIQAADVSHTMQHWDVYREWNKRLFHELYVAWKAGRAEKNPADFWYQGEIGFYDFYIIPLAKKLSECGVFGVSSDENLNYALRNREQWELHGRVVVDEMLKCVRLEEEEDETNNMMDIKQEDTEVWSGAEPNPENSHVAAWNDEGTCALDEDAENPMEHTAQDEGEGIQREDDAAGTLSGGSIAHAMPEKPEDEDLAVWNDEDTKLKEKKSTRATL